ncbi:hypothetical protein [Catellatospora sichuanensis]|uniref:hypothetical protein n=1 Tax=Catellatospora sichuanensis TaxID=1969805 RepID=UPI0011844585|nr:hypothetical protein [Catellatospora sichuanensis]
MSSLLTRQAVRLLAVVTCTGLVGAASPAAAAPADPLSIKSINFSVDHVDARGDWTVVPLEWTVRDADPAAEQVLGQVKLHALDGAGNRVGQVYEIDFEFGEQWYTEAQFVSGTPQESTYHYDFVVPRYGKTKQALWAVTEVTLKDDRGAEASVRGTALGAATLKARTLVDSTPPSVQYFNWEAIQADKPYVYVKDTIGYQSFYAPVSDGGAGFWKGTLRLAGPGGRTLDTDFELKYFTDDKSCGRYTGGDLYGPSCGILVQFPPGTASGQWRVAELILVDNVGNTASLTGLAPDTVITVTSNETVSASGFTATPNPVDNWNADVTARVGATITGAQNGVTEIVVEFDVFGCRQTSTTPTDDGNGKYSVPVRVPRQVKQCNVLGFTAKDGAGNVAAYGPDYGAPAVGLRIDRLANTTPPTATGATLTPTTIARSQAGNVAPKLTVQVVAPIAPVGSYSLYLYDAEGTIVAQQGGGTSVVNGVLTVYGYLPYGIEAGDYTYGFVLHDGSGLSTTYGPEGLPVPGGPLLLTVTDA